MKLLGACIGLIFLSLGIASQTPATSKLAGTIYDGNGAVVLNAKVTAENSKGRKFEAVSGKNGNYVITLPIGEVPEHPEKYDITVESAQGFKKTEIKQFIFIPSPSGKMRLDIGLEAPPAQPMIEPERL